MKGILVKDMICHQGKTLAKQCMQRLMHYYNALMLGLLIQFM
jgi:hypothetical protein